MNTQHEYPGKDQEPGGQEIDRTHESYEKGYPAPGTRHAGEEAKDVAANDEDHQHDLGAERIKKNDPSNNDDEGTDSRKASTPTKGL